MSIVVGIMSGIIVAVFNTAPYSGAGPGLTQCAGFCPGAGPIISLVLAVILILVGIEGVWNGANNKTAENPKPAAVEMTVNPIAAV